MKKNCGNCKHRTQGTDTHMVCGMRSYLCRVSKNDVCSKYKSNIPTKKKQYIIGIGYPWYGDACDSQSYRPQTSHGLGSIKLMQQPLSHDYSTEIIMLNPKKTHSGKKYKLILEEC
jgi:hypothetical protein